MATNPLYEGPVYETIDDVVNSLPTTRPGNSLPSLPTTRPDTPLHFLPTTRPESPPGVKEAPYVSLFPTYENNTKTTSNPEIDSLFPKYENSDLTKMTSNSEMAITAGQKAVCDDSYTVMMSAAPAVRYSEVKRVQRPPTEGTSGGTQPTSGGTQPTRIILQSISTDC